MSYDIRLGVKVDGTEDLYAVIAEPYVSHPTYNIGEMLRACTGWDFSQGEWYKVSDVLPKIKHGISELIINEEHYKQYISPNGYGTTKGALETLDSLLTCIKDNDGDSGWSWNTIPEEHLYVCW